MTVTAYIPALVAVIGLLVYFLATKGETKETGRLMFACGLLVTLFTLASKVVRLP